MKSRVIAVIIVGVVALIALFVSIGWPQRTQAPSVTKPSDKSDIIVVDFPKPGDIVSSPLVVKGRARGNWFFEASFPAELIQIAEGTDGAPDMRVVLAQTFAQAEGDWMTTDFVPFEATMMFPPIRCGESKCAPQSATLVLKKDNPSGLPQTEDSISIPVSLSTDIPVSSSASCRPTGCSGQVCSDQEVITTCEYRADYACYKTAKCGRQAGGQCGWTQTPELTRCLQNPPPLR